MTFVTNISYPPQVFEQSLFLFLQDPMGPVRKFPLFLLLSKGPDGLSPFLLRRMMTFMKFSFFFLFLFLPWENVGNGGVAF